MGAGVIFACVSSPFDYNKRLYFSALCTRFDSVALFESVHLIFCHLFVIVLFALVFSGGQLIIFLYVNSFVHVVMYTYYLLSIYNPVKIKSSIVIKKNITRLQIVSLLNLINPFLHF